ncbi:MAG TPA: ABC transporter ATP-binding protein [Myxococcales bacterium]|nr:ABC transporter ATP-binding protein [Myxococcales bacterium]
MPEAALSFRGVGKDFGGGVVALQGIDLDVAPGEFVCFLGPSGCGKSTLLNIAAGFVAPTAGEVKSFGQRVVRPGPDRAMVFQEYALFPWMTVLDNVAFGLTVKRDPQAREKARALLDKLQLKAFGDRFPKDLSGGMRQRVALARALAVDAPMLLMDEPFGALDALTRRSMQAELLRIWAEYRKTIVFVTHGIDESVTMADRVVVFTYRPGTVKQIVALGLPRPRDAASPGFTSALKQLTGLVAEEQARHERDETTR